MTEQQLILKIQSGETQYINQLLEDNLQKIFQSCYRVCLDETDANDITQEVIIKIIKNINGFQGNSNFSTWYYRIAYNESINFLRKKKEDYSIGDFENYLTNENTDFYNDDKKLLEKDINTAINSLSIIDRNIILYFYFDEIKIKDIAQVLDINENTVKTRLKRAKLKLHGLLPQYENIN